VNPAGDESPGRRLANARLRRVTRGGGPKRRRPGRAVRL